jgi:acyl-CoA thioesterase-1
MMTHWFAWMVAVFSSLAAAASGEAADPAVSGGLRVACVGDSITAGSGIADRTMTYPAQLARLLGEQWVVKNFGVSGATMMNSCDKPYQNEGKFREAVEFKPDVVVIKLGTNDTKPHNWKASAENFTKDSKLLLAAFREANAKVKIFLCTPAPAFPENFGIRESVIAAETLPLIRALATEEKLPLIDLHEALKDHPEFFKDKVHPDADGAAVIAAKVFEALTGKAQ